MAHEWPLAGHYNGQSIVGVGKLIAHGVVVNFRERALLPVRSEIRRWGGNEVCILVHVLEPEHKIVGRERMPVAPPHAPTQMKGERPATIANLPTLGDVGEDFRARIVK